jgi:hypothetical protein
MIRGLSVSNIVVGDGTGYYNYGLLTCMDIMI